MGSFFSKPPAEANTQEEKLPISERRSPPYLGYMVPADASTAPHESQYWYTDFYEQTSCVPHRDGKSIILCWSLLHPREIPDPREREGWHVTKVRKVYERLDEDHPRIVRYVGRLQDKSIVVERLWPGPLKGMTFPAMIVPIHEPDVMPRQDRLMLSLYYRWALQSLSALRCLHSHSVFIKFFSGQQVWLRSDYSLAIAGFISACIENGVKDEEEEQEGFFGDGGGWAGDETFMYDETLVGGCAKEDMFFWALFVWRLMTNCYTEKSPESYQFWDPLSPLEGGLLYDKPGAYEAHRKRYERDEFQELEEARLGRIFVKAWRGEYETVDEVVEEVKQAALKLGMKVVGDEIEIGERWEDVFYTVQTDRYGQNKETKFQAHQ